MGEVGRLAVSPTHRRRGVAEMLMKTAITHAKANGLRSLKLFTSDFHKAATTMYMKRGWTLEKRIPYEGFSDWWRFIIVFRKELV